MENGSRTHGELWGVVCDDGDFGGRVGGGDGRVDSGREGPCEPLYNLRMELERGGRKGETLASQRKKATGFETGNGTCTLTRQCAYCSGPTQHWETD